MAALVSTVPTRAGTVSAGAAVAASDQVDISQLGAVNGALLEINNGNASPDNMTISDAGATPAGTQPGTYAATVANGAAKVFVLSPKQVDSAGKITITHSVTSSVTYKLYPLT